MIKPQRLKAGSTVGIVSPSWGGPAAFPHRMELGIAALAKLGYKVKIGAHARDSMGYVSDTPENRASDIHAMFLDPEVSAIVASIGGDHSCQLLPHLDFALIRSNPKIIMGYSDITVLNIAIWQATGLVTFNGPALMTDFAEYPQMLDYTERHLLAALARSSPVGDIEPATGWTEEFLDWEQKEDLKRPRAITASQGWTWLKDGAGLAEGILIGGCLESLQHLRGTSFWPAALDWEGALFFFETSEEKPSPAKIDGILMDYENMGVLQRLGALLVGRPMQYSDGEKQHLRDIVLERTKRYNYPVIMDMDFGHTAPQFTLPVGCRALVDPAAHRFAITEAAVGE